MYPNSPESFRCFFTSCHIMLQRWLKWRCWTRSCDPVLDSQNAPLICTWWSTGSERGRPYQWPRQNQAWRELYCCRPFHPMLFLSVLMFLSLFITYLCVLIALQCLISFVVRYQGETRLNNTSLISRITRTIIWLVLTLLTSAGMYFRGYRSHPLTFE